MSDRYFEDYTPGIDVTYGAEQVLESDVLRFAREFDPQTIHTDPEAADGGPFGGLIASGWHTASLMMQIFATEILNDRASLASPGVDELLSATSLLPARASRAWRQDGARGGTASEPAACRAR
ncbi:MaoC dehydratase-like protein [Curtobacterium sp. PhB136]|nr:MaoC dehydratase-like protein [Curtobacterium sp. PhB136]